MKTLICNYTIEYIMKSIDLLQKVKHIRPTTEEIYNSIRKELNDELDIVEYKTNIDYLINNGIVEVRDESDRESLFIVERTEESSEESGERNILETNIQTEIHMPQKEDGNTAIRLGNVVILYDGLISNLKSEINFLKNQLLAKDTFFPDEVTFLRKQLSEALAKKVDTSVYLSTSAIAVNADEPPVNGDLVNSKPEESTKRSESKNTNTKEKSNAETNVNSNTSNKEDKEDRQKRKMKSSRERYQQNITIRKIKIKVRKS